MVRGSYCDLFFFFWSSTYSKAEVAIFTQHESNAQNVDSFAHPRLAETRLGFN